MKVGISLSAMGRTGPDEVAGYARHAEEVGLDSVFVGDHLVANGRGWACHCDQRGGVALKRRSPNC